MGFNVDILPVVPSEHKIEQNNWGATLYYHNEEEEYLHDVITFNRVDFCLAVWSSI